MISNTNQSIELPDNISLNEKTLSAKAAEIVREKIIKGKYPMGTRLMEADFADAMGVSRASIREAFMILQGEGLLVRQTNRSTSVVTLRPEDIRNIYHLRAAIEMACMEISVEERRLDVGRLRQLADKISSNAALAYVEDEESLIQWIIDDLSFHEYMLKQAGNSYAEKVWSTIKYQTLMLLHTAARLAPHAVTPVGAEFSHDLLIELIELENTPELLALLKQHILSGAISVMNAMRLLGVEDH